MQQQRTILIRPEHQNHAGQLFGGLMMQWADEMAFIAATLTYPKAQFVTKLFHEFNFLSPAELGDIIQISSEVIDTGNTACTVSITAKNLTRKRNVFTTSAVLVHVKNGAKAQIPH